MQLIKINYSAHVDQAVLNEAALNTFIAEMNEAIGHEPGGPYTCPIMNCSTSNHGEDYAEEWDANNLTDDQEKGLTELLSANQSVDWDDVVEFFANLGYAEKEDGQKFEPELADLGEKLTDGGAISAEEADDLKWDTYEELLPKVGKDGDTARTIFWAAAQNLAGDPPLDELRQHADGDTPSDVVDSWEDYLKRKENEAD